MSSLAAAGLFVVCLALTLASSEALVRGLDRLGARLGLSEGLLGLLTALGADAPEVSSAIVALQAGAHDVGLGVVLGSNIFNLAALLGLGALAAGRIQVQREGLLLDGGVAVLVTAVAAALLLGWLGPWPALLLLAVLLVPYVVALGTRPSAIARWALPDAVSRLLALAIKEVDIEAAEDPRVSHAAGPWRAALLIPPALALIVAASVGMVSSALTLAATWHLPSRLVGAVILAGLTSLPNAYAALRLAVQGRGAAVVSEALNSNTINLLAGVALPALIFGAAGGAGARLELAWVVGMTALSLLLLAGPRGLTRGGGATLVLGYAIFVVIRVTQP
jgi:cation:H+ antiporter